MNTNTNYGEWLRNWINVYKKPYIKTWETIKSHIANHIPQAILKTKLNKLNAFEIQKAINDIKNSRTRVELYDIYHGSLSYAYKLGFLERDLSQLLIKPKHVRKIGSALSAGELTVFLHKILGHKTEFYFKFLLLTGCRRSEALNIKYEDIDYINRVIYIHGTKNYTSDRVLPMSSELYLLLKSFVGDTKYYKLFHHRPDYVTKTFKKVCPTHKLHDLRHTFATRCFECGISTRVVQEWLGHARIDTTAKIYTHLADGFSSAEMLKFKLF